MSDADDRIATDQRERAVVREDLRQIVEEADTRHREVLVNAFLRRCARLFARYARSLCRSNSVPATRYEEDIEAIVAAEAWELITEAIADPDLLDGMTTFEARLFVRVRPKVRSFVDRFESPASGMVAARRRVREVAKTRSALRRQGIEPSTNEVLAQTNKRLRATRKDAERQRVLVDVSTLIGVAPPIPVSEGAITIPGPNVSDIVCNQVVARVLDTARRSGAQTEWVAAAYMAEVLETGITDGSEMTRHIVQSLGIRVLEANELLHRVRAELARQMLHVGLIDDPRLADVS